MSLTRRIALNTAAQIAGKILSTILGLVAVAMLTRYLGIEKFGWYTTTIAFLQFVAILIDFGLVPVTAQMLGENKYDKITLIKNLLGFRFITAIIFLGIAPLAAWLFPYPQEVKLAITFTTISFLAIAVNQVLTGYYQNELKMHVPAIGEIIGRVVLVAGLAMLMRQGSSFLPLMAVISISSVAYTAFLWHMAAKTESIGFSFNLEIWRTIFYKSWPIAISIIFNVVYLRGDTILLSLIRSQADVGLYGAAYRVLDILAQMAMMLMGLMLPILAAAHARRDTIEFSRRYQQSFDAMMFFAVPMTVGAVLLATPIMKLVAGAEFAASGPILAVLAFAVFGLYLGAVFGHTAVAINRQKATMWIYISDAVITLIGYLIFIPRYGLMGAAWMTVFSELYAGLLLWYVIRWFGNARLRLSGFMKILASSVVMAIVIYLASSLPTLIIVLLGALVYISVLASLGGISRATLKEIFCLT